MKNLNNSKMNEQKWQWVLNQVLNNPQNKDILKSLVIAALDDKTECEDTFIELVQRGSGLENLTDAEKKGNIEFQKVLNINSITSKF
tara:strand:- start:1625 stop:1885 length:261 start_codon:yes stop_codon:yes gene_type:complete